MVQALEEIIAKSSSVVFFGGAGVSTESGIPDFRSVDGLYHQKYAYPPETILSHTFWEENPEEFYRFYRDKLIVKGAKPNAAHLRLAKLEREGRLKAVVTQNIDGLHQAAGSRTVYELHGSTLRNYCTRCGKFYDVDFIANSTGVPRCTECGGIVKPDVVLYEEGLDEEVLSGAVNAIRHADTLIIGGTSLVVYPAAGLIRYFRGGHLVVINMQPTGADAGCILKKNGGNQMIQVCDPPRTRQVRRLSAEEFCQLAQSEVSSVYRPRSEVLRMLTVGEVWGVYSARGVPGAGCILLPMDADVAAAAALRRFLGWNRTSGGYFLTPAAGPDGHAAETLAPLLAAAAARQEFLARQRARWAVVECAAEELIPLYLRQGFALRAIRPLDSLAPCFLLQAGCLAQNVPPVWLPLADRVHIAILLARGYAALESRESPQGTVLALYPV